MALGARLQFGDPRRTNRTRESNQDTVRKRWSPDMDHLVGRCAGDVLEEH